MISVEEASRIVQQNSLRFGPELVSVHSSLGRILDEDLIADMDLPPFDRVMMDGVAIRFSDWENGIRTFSIAGMQRAGQSGLELQAAASAIEIMTGAVCPKNADAIIPYEMLSIDGSIAHVQATFVKRWQNLHRQGSDKKKHDLVVPKSTRLTPAEIGVAASIGKTFISVVSPPRVHIFSTGDELVEISETPDSSQIRRSNVFALQQMLVPHGVLAGQSHVNDNYEDIKAELVKALDQNDVLLLTGGVSKGKYDFLPEVLEELGVKKLFHHIAQRPGKPMWFGRKDEKVVFAFPGNPVSTFLCAVRYMEPWLRASFGMHTPALYAQLGEDFRKSHDLTHFLQVKLSIEKDATIWAHPVAGGGSGDFVNLVQADAFLELPSSASSFKRGDVFRLFPYRTL